MRCQRISIEFVESGISSELMLGKLFRMSKDDK